MANKELHKTLWDSLGDETFRETIGYRGAASNVARKRQGTQIPGYSAGFP